MIVYALGGVAVVIGGMGLYEAVAERAPEAAIKLAYCVVTLLLLGFGRRV